MPAGTVLAEGFPSIAPDIAGWMQDLLAEPDVVVALIDRYGSPLNILSDHLLPEHAQELVDAGCAAGVDVRVFFARKANKAIAFVDSALQHGHGVDVASVQELQQVLFRKKPHHSGDIVVTAAVKDRDLLTLAVASDSVISIDNDDEVSLVREVGHEMGLSVRIAPRLAVDAGKPSRFGMRAKEIARLHKELTLGSGRVVVAGYHFHVDGYSPSDRVRGLHQALDLVDDARGKGHAPKFIDIGGGVPMRYTCDEGAWQAAVGEQERNAEGTTWRGMGWGHTYPLYQPLVRGEWVGAILAARRPVAGGETIARALRDRGLAMHVEPGRALLDGGGLTLARVASRKRADDGSWLVGLAMNRTQCRSAADDFPLDPVLLPTGTGERSSPGSGFLVGAFCIENEVITRRRLKFPVGVAVGDHVAFINTAGYLMHIVESSSHQLPLAWNLVRRGAGSRGLSADGFVTDAIHHYAVASALERLQAADQAPQEQRRNPRTDRVVRYVTKTGTKELE